MVYTDYEKAFHHVDHCLLFRKVHENGVREKLPNLLKSYLNNRQRVRVNGHDSDYVNVTRVLPKALLSLVYTSS